MTENKLNELFKKNAIIYEVVDCEICTYSLATMPPLMKNVLFHSLKLNQVFETEEEAEEHLRQIKEENLIFQCEKCKQDCKSFIIANNLRLCNSCYLAHKQSRKLNSHYSDID